MNRLDETFARLRASGELALIPYLMTGHPDPASCGELLTCLAESGADAIELGVPFSDPLADGPTIQRAGAQALARGGSLAMALDLVRGLRARRSTPTVVMTYFNLLLAFGLERFAHEAQAAGLDGLIVADLPLDEAEPVRRIGLEHDLHLVQLVAPTSTDARLAETARMASGFIYCVALVGVTGARARLADELPGFLRRVRAACPQPLVVGFGISGPEHVAAVRGQADGVVVASALVDLIESTPPDRRRAAVAEYVRALKEATRPSAAPLGAT
jgi:tryptophan synthase alpha chain